MAGVYIHIPYCKQRCSYCAFVSGAPLSSQSLYVQRLKEEMRSRLNKSVTIDTVYVGGGTPSMLKRGLLTDIFHALSDLGATNAKEITVECNPDSVDEEFVAEILALNVNRVSIGLQTDNDELLKAVNRPHDKTSFLRAWKLLERINNKSVDVMLGLPHQTLDDVVNTADFVTSLKPQHISAYSLAVEQGTPLQKSGFVADDDGEADMYDLLVKKLSECGYKRYEVSNFCLDGFESKHNGSYWDLSDYYGFGVSAHSLVNGVRTANTDSIDEYLCGKTTVSAEKCNYPEEYVMLSLRTSKGISLSKLLSYGCDILMEKKKEVDRLLDRNLIYIEGDKLALTEGAYYLMNDVITDLM